MSFVYASMVCASCALIAGVTSALAYTGVWRLEPSTHSPTARVGHTMIIDKQNDRIILFGGEDANGQKNDVWRMNLSTFQWDSISTQGTQPSTRDGAAAIFDPGSLKMILFGGDHGGAAKSDQWELTLPATADSATWTQLDTTSAACAREDHTAVYAPSGNSLSNSHSPSMFVFGGHTFLGEDVYHNDLWGTAPPTSTAWGMQWPSTINCAQYTACSSCPTVRAYHSEIYDTANNRIVVFGGDYDGFSGVSNSSHISSLSPTVGGWSTQQSVPTGTPNYSRSRHASDYDPASGGRLLCFGGYSTATTGSCASLAFYNSTTAMSLASATDGTWSTDNTSDPPRARYQLKGVFDTKRNRFIIFGGSFAIANPGAQGACDSMLLAPYKTNETWVLDYSAIGDLSVCSISKGCATLQWSAPGGNGVTIQQYDIRYSSSAITESNFSNAAQVSAPSPASPGTVQYASQTGLSASHTYYFAMKAKSGGYWSIISNVPSATTLGTGSTACIDCSGNAARPYVDEDARLGLTLMPPSPNPALTMMDLQYTMPRSLDGARLELAIFDVLGRRVRTLREGTSMAGSSALTWDLLDTGGHRVGRGLYYARLTVGSERRTRALIVQ